MSGVAGVHSLNIWSLTMDKNVVSVHLSVGQCFITLLNYQITILHAYAKINAVKVRIVQSHEQVLCFTDYGDFRGRSVRQILGNPEKCEGYHLRALRFLSDNHSVRTTIPYLGLLPESSAPAIRSLRYQTGILPKFWRIGAVKCVRCYSQCRVQRA